jgi:predicted HicB family RNase H-like nuclease
MRQVFGNDGIRSAEEQRASLQKRIAGKAHQTAVVEFDPDLQALRIGSKQIAMRQISKAIARAAPSAEVPVGKRTPVAIPDGLHRSLRARAAAESRSVEELLIQILWSAGIVEE